MSQCGLSNNVPRARSQLLLNTMVVDAGNLDGKPKRRFRRSDTWWTWWGIKIALTFHLANRPPRSVPRSDIHTRRAWLEVEGPSRESRAANGRSGRYECMYGWSRSLVKGVHRRNPPMAMVRRTRGQCRISQARSCSSLVDITTRRRWSQGQRQSQSIAFRVELIETVEKNNAIHLSKPTKHDRWYILPEYIFPNILPKLFYDSAPKRSSRHFANSTAAKPIAPAPAASLMTCTDPHSTPSRRSPSSSRPRYPLDIISPPPNARADSSGLAIVRSPSKHMVRSMRGTMAFLAMDKAAC